MPSDIKQLDLGYCPLADPEYGFRKLGPEKLAELLIPPAPHIIVHIDYPLFAPAKSRLKPDDATQGFTRKEIIDGVVAMYKRVYAVGRATVPSGTEPDARAGGMMLNKGFTARKYRIWGHDMEDLVLRTGFYNDKAKEMTLALDS